MSVTSTITNIVLNFPWPEILANAWKYGYKIIRGLTPEGMYETLVYESTLELLNKEGTKARFHKRKKVRYLQDNIIAYQDYAWGDGNILRYYRCTPGKPVDHYRLGYKTYVLLSLREVKSRGYVDEFNIQWNIKDGFLVSDGFWDTDISHRTKYLRVTVIFPEDRHPKRVILVESNQRRTHILGDQNIKELPDGRLRVIWEKKNPRTSVSPDRTSYPY